MDAGIWSGTKNTYRLAHFIRRKGVLRRFSEMNLFRISAETDWQMSPAALASEADRLMHDAELQKVNEQTGNKVRHGGLTFPKEGIQVWPWRAPAPAKTPFTMCALEKFNVCWYAYPRDTVFDVGEYHADN